MCYNEDAERKSKDIERSMRFRSAGAGQELQALIQEGRRFQCTVKINRARSLPAARFSQHPSKLTRERRAGLFRVYSFRQKGNFFHKKNWSWSGKAIIPAGVRKVEEKKPENKSLIERKNGLIFSNWPESFQNRSFYGNIISRKAMAAGNVSLGEKQQRLRNVSLWCFSIKQKVNKEEIVRCKRVRSFCTAFLLHAEIEAGEGWLLVFVSK